MHTVDIKVFCIAQTRLNPEATREWLDHMGAIQTPVPRVKQECSTAQQPEITDAGAVCGLCAKRCYMSFEPGLNPNVTRVRKEWYKYLSNILKSGHGSVTEHATWTFAIEGVSRVFTGEMNRHRAGVSISEGSMRYIRYDDIGFWMPVSIEEGNQMLMPTRKCRACGGSGNVPLTRDTLINDADEVITCPDCMGAKRINLMTDEEFEETKALTRGIFNNAFIDMESNYTALCNIWDINNLAFDVKKKLTSLFRRIIGMGIATGGCWTLNTRALRHVVALRTTEHAEEEMALVIGMIGKWIIDHEPTLFSDFTLDKATGAWVPKHVKI